MTDKQAKKARVKALHEAKLARELERIKALGDDPDTVWPTSAAALLLGVTPGALAKWRGDGDGPVYIELSKTRVGYRKRALKDFIEKRERQSTSASSVAAAPPQEADK